MQPQPVQMQVQTAPPASSMPGGRSQYTGAAKTLGILQLILSVLSCGFTIAECVSWHICTYVFSGIWGSVLFYLPAGILGILSVTTPASARKGLAIACMVMSILAALMAIANLGFYLAAVAYNVSYYYVIAPLALDAFVSLVSLAELIVAIVAAVYSGRISCERQSTNMITIGYYPQVGTQPQYYPPQQQQNAYVVNLPGPTDTSNTTTPMGQTGYADGDKGDWSEK